MVLYLNKNILIGCDDDWMGKINGIDSCLLTLWGKEGVYYSQRLEILEGDERAICAWVRDIEIADDFLTSNIFLQLRRKHSSYFRI